jgi:hypothetical protein
MNSAKHEYVNNININVSYFVFQDQYQFIHFGVQEYLDSFSDYANFK